MPIPSKLENAFRIATSSDIRSWSFGALTARRDTSASFLDNVKGTLHDQRIFGPIRDYICACRKYSGENYANMICDSCGVRVAHKSIRSTRFGHIELTNPVQHPFDTKTMLSCFPVIPGDYIQSPGGEQLQALYDDMIESNANDDHDRLVETLAAIVEWLTPIVLVMDQWNVSPVRNTLARGMALEPRRSRTAHTS
jgi:hypothetical protein